ncbi:MAG: DUF2141 domain-containing protein [Saprospiraceae bacterium]
MKHIRTTVPTVLLSGILIMVVTQSFLPGYGTIVFRVRGMETSKGVVRVALYDSDKSFLSEFGFAAADSAFAFANSSVNVVIKNVPFGTYAAAIYQDENQNGVIDQNMVRIPTEPYAFSNGIHAKWSIPDFKQVAFTFDQQNMKQEVELRSWSKQ